MKKTMLHKDFNMEIAKSLNRFISIFLIVALGVAFFSGIRATEPDIRYSADEYFDEHNLMDIRVISTMGLTDEDADALRTIDKVVDVAPGYTVDALTQIEDTQSVFKIISDKKTMNQIDVTAGRLPEKKGECLLDSGSLGDNGYQIGDKITFLLTGEDELSETLVTDTYEVVGVGSSPEYITFSRGSTAIGDGEISAFAIVAADSFCLDAYTQIDITVAGAADEVAYTEDYDSLIDEIMTVLEDDVADLRCDARYQSIMAEAEEELAEAEAELNDEEAKAESELADARTELEDAAGEIEEGQQTLDEKCTELDDARVQIESSQQQIDSGSTEIHAARNELDSQWDTYHTNKTQFDAQAAEYDAQKGDAEAQQAAARAELDAGWDEYNQGMTMLAGLRGNLVEMTEQIEYLESLGGGEELQQLYAGKTMLEAQIAEMETQLGGAKQQLDAGENEYNSGYQQYIAAGETLESFRQQLESGYAELSSAESQLAQKQDELSQGQEQLTAAKDQLSDGEAQIAEARQELEDARQQLSDGWQEYEDGKAEAEEQLADARQKLTDVRSDINDIEYPKWYLFDRSYLTRNSEFGDNAKRIRSIGEVFPVLFFLVAALISLTTMTRMVEEQRTQIGTLKALGYGKAAIAMKYILYALLAALGGSLAGVLIGEKALPTIIIKAYQIMYPHIPNVVVPYDMQYSLLATLAAVLCITAAAFAACWRELADNPAALMRPEPPKQGKRILLERVVILWKHLSFTQKSTLRNLFRYKKRFLMTVIGIGSCMALMIVGFGIKDSIRDIAPLQYGKIQLYDGMAVLKEDISDAELTRLYTGLDEDDRVENYKAIHMVNTDITAAKSGTGTMEAYLVVPESPDQMENFYLFNDRISGEQYTLDDSGVMLSEKTAKMLDIKEGESIRILQDGFSGKDVTVTHIVENYVMHYIYMSPALYNRTFGKTAEHNSILLKMDDSPAGQGKAVGEKFLQYDAVLNITYMDSVKQQMDDIMGSLDLVVIVLIASAGLLAFVVLYNLNNININERKRELASIKVLGFYDNELAAYIYRENIYLTIIGSVLGIILGKILHQFVIVTVEIDNCMFGRMVALPSYIYSILFTMAFSVIVNFVMYFKLRKVDMVQSLKSVE